MSELKPFCPHCSSQHTVKNGRTHNKKPKRKCQNCGRQFVVSPLKKYIFQTGLEYIEKLLLEKIPLAEIARVTGVDKKWLRSLCQRLICPSSVSDRSACEAFKKINC